MSDLWKDDAIEVPEWLREERPTCAKFCDLINSLLRCNPGTSLATFAWCIQELIEREDEEWTKEESV